MDILTKRFNCFFAVALVTALLGMGIGPVSAAEAKGPKDPVKAALKAKAEEAVTEGKKHQEQYNADKVKNGPALIEAALDFARAHDLYEKSGDTDAVVEAQASLFWCKKQMNLMTMQEFMRRRNGTPVPRQAEEETKPARKPEPTEVELAVAKAEAFAKAHPEDPAAVAESWRSVARKFEDTPDAPKAQAKADAAEQAYRTKIRSGEIQVATRISRLVKAPAGSQAIPSAEEQKRALGDLKKTFASAWVKRGNADRRKLAERLLTEAQTKAKDAALVWVASSEVLRIAQELEDYDGALDIIERLAARFSGFDAKAQAVTAFKAQAGRVTGQALATLCADPKDASANVVAGRYFAITLGQWQDGLPMFVRGNDAEIRAVAVEDYLEPQTDEAIFALGESWQALGKKRNDKEFRLGCFVRAQYWLSKIEVTSTGEARARVTKMLEELNKVVPQEFDFTSGKAITPQQWDRLKGPEIEVTMHLDQTRSTITLKPGERVRVVPHPSERWAVHRATQGDWEVDGRGVTAKGERIFGRGDDASAGLPLGALTMGVGTSPRQETGVISGPGLLWFEPFRGDAKPLNGAIRVKVVAVPNE